MEALDMKDSAETESIPLTFSLFLFPLAQTTVGWNDIQCVLSLLFKIYIVTIDVCQNGKFFIYFVHLLIHLYTRPESIVWPY